MVLYQGYFYATTMRCQTDLRALESLVLRPGGNKTDMI